MKLSNAIKKLKSVSETEIVQKGQSYVGTINKHYVSFCQNGREDSAICFHVQRFDDVSDSQSDYFAGCFLDNLSQAIRFASR